MLSYDPLTGIFHWLVSGHGIAAGQAAGSVIDVGGRKYIEIGVDRRRLYAHVLTVFYMTGEWPLEMVGFVDGNWMNLAYANLVRCTPAELQRRSLAPIKGNTTGLRGVSVDRRTGGFRASIKVDGTKIHLGRYQVAEDAYEDYLAARALMHGVDVPPRARGLA